jgi:hypothetical protein
VGLQAPVHVWDRCKHTQFLGELNRVDANSRYQIDVVEANVLAHIPWLTEGGIDLKVGQ